MTSTATDMVGDLRIVNRKVGKSLKIVEAVTAAPIMRLSIDGASTLEVTVADHRRELIRHPVVDERSWAVVNGIHFELVGLAKSGDSITLTFEDAIVAELRRHTKPLVAPAYSTTRREFAKRLAREAGVKISVDPGARANVRTPLQRSADGQKSNSWEVLGSDVAEPIRWRRFSDGSQLVIGGDEWLISRLKPVELAEGESGVISIDFDLDVAKRASTATATIDTKLFNLRPGHPVRVRRLGPANGLWIISSLTQAITSTRATVELVRKAHVLKEPKRKGGSGEKGDTGFLPGTTTKDTGSKAGNAAREKMLRYALAQKGKAYVWGGNGPNGFDCSGLVQMATKAAGNTLGKPAADQWKRCVAQRKTVSIETALKTRGALLFRVGVGGTNHVAISLANDSTIEARGTGYGVGVFSGAKNRGWTGGAIWL